MSELISGKEALIALANGEILQYRFPDGIWLDFTNNLNSSGSNLRVVDLLNDYACFRLKPSTIEINGVEMNEPRLIHKVGPLLLSLEFGSESECNVFLKTLQNRKF